MAEGSSALNLRDLLTGLLPHLFSCLSTSVRFKQNTGNRWRKCVCLTLLPGKHKAPVFFSCKISSLKTGNVLTSFCSDLRWAINNTSKMLRCVWKIHLGYQMTNRNNWQWHKYKLLATMKMEQKNLNAKWRHVVSHTKTVLNLSKAHDAVGKCIALFCVCLGWKRWQTQCCVLEQSKHTKAALGQNLIIWFILWNHIITATLTVNTQRATRWFQ